MKIHYSDLYSTYSIVARDAETGDLGVAVQTHNMCVGKVVPWLSPGLGAIATQAASNVSFGPLALTLLREGVPAPRVIDALVATDPDAHRRQVAVVDAKGRVGAWTGQGCIAEAMHQIGEGYSVQANMMTHPTVVRGMATAYERATGDLAHRMLTALVAAQAEGGDIRGMQSAALKVVSGDARRPAWKTIYDLRVDEHEYPVQELARLVRLRHAQLLDAAGEQSFKQGEVAQAFAQWSAARAKAPELEELAFWQAVTLVEESSNVEAAADILRPVLAQNPRRAHWIDLIRRLRACGMIERAGAAEELIAALG